MTPVPAVQTTGEKWGVRGGPGLVSLLPGWREVVSGYSKVQFCFWVETTWHYFFFQLTEA